MLLVHGLLLLAGPLFSQTASSPTVHAAPLWVPLRPSYLKPPATLKDAGVSLDSPAAERLRLDSTFDGRKADDPALPMWPVGHELSIQNGQFKRYALTVPGHGFTAELGQLGIVTRNPLLDRSLYGGVREDLSHEGAVDATLKLQAAGIGLRARYFYDDDPAMDKKVGDTIDAAQEVATQHGYQDPTYFDALRQDIKVDTSFQQTPLFVGSALGQVGKTFRTMGPFDLGLVAGALVRVTGPFPSGSLDQTMALRMRAPGGNSVGVFGGVTEAVGYFNDKFWGQTFESRKAAVDVHLDGAPHVGAEVWGTVPRLKGSEYELGVTHLFGPMTQRTEVHGRVFQPLRSGGVSLGGRYEREVGDAIEYSRQKASGELGVYPDKDTEIYAGYAYEKFRYGDASLDNQAFMVGVRGQQGSGSARDVLSLERVFGGQDQMALPAASVQSVLDQIQGLADFIDALGTKGSSGGDMPPAISQAYGRLEPQMLDAVQQAASGPGAPAPGSPAPKSSLSPGQIISLATTLVDPDVYERIVVLYLRHRLLDYMSTKRVPLLGQDIQLTPGTVLALANAIGTGLAPLPPVTAKDLPAAADFVSAEVLKQIGMCQNSPSQDALIDCALGQLAPDKAQALKDKYGDRLKDALKTGLEWGAEFIRREIDREALQLIVAAEALNEVTVDRGFKLHELDQQWLAAAFKKMDRKERGRLGKVLKRTKSSLASELKAQETLLKLRLAAFGKARLESLPGVEVPSKDWPALLDFYGDDALFAFIQQARAKLPAGTKLRVEFTPFADIGIAVERESGTSVIVKLSPVKTGFPPEKMLASALEAL